MSTNSTCCMRAFAHYRKRLLCCAVFSSAVLLVAVFVVHLLTLLLSLEINGFPNIHSSIDQYTVCQEFWLIANGAIVLQTLQSPNYLSVERCQAIQSRAMFNGLDGHAFPGLTCHFSPIWRRNAIRLMSRLGCQLPDVADASLFQSGGGITQYTLPLWMLELPLLVLLIMCRRDWKRKHDERYCAVCQYDLTGNHSGVCPECGTAVPLCAPSIIT